jgi:hypothetical protein
MHAGAPPPPPARDHAPHTRGRARLPGLAAALGDAPAAAPASSPPPPPQLKAVTPCHPPDTAADRGQAPSGSVAADSGVGGAPRPGQGPPR